MRIIRIAAIIAAVALTLAALPLHAQKPQPAGLARIAWLAGCWESVTPRRSIEEVWMAPRAGTMLGMGRTVRGDSLFQYELVVIREQAGRLAYEAHPSGQPSETFPAREVTDTSVVFENLAHDFPQRVGYELVSADSVVAWIEGSRGGNVRRIDFPYRRVRCAGK